MVIVLNTSFPQLALEDEIRITLGSKTNIGKCQLPIIFKRKCENSNLTLINDSFPSCDKFISFWLEVSEFVLIIVDIS